MARPKVLFVLTSQRQMGSADKETGWYLPEFAHPYYKLYPHSDIVVASPKGGEAPLDPSSVEGSKDEESVKFLNEKKDLWTKTEKLSDFKGKAGGFAAIFYVGGHGRKFLSLPLTLFLCSFMTIYYVVLGLECCCICKRHQGLRVFTSGGQMSCYTTTQ